MEEGLVDKARFFGITDKRPDLDVEVPADDHALGFELGECLANLVQVVEGSLLVPPCWDEMDANHSNPSFGTLDFDGNYGGSLRHATCLLTAIDVVSLRGLLEDPTFLFLPD